MWVTLADAITDLRATISDGPTDKLCEKKAIFGDQNGVNLQFKTFERRRVTDFSVAPAAGSPEGIYLDDVLLAPVSGVAADDLTSGVFTLAASPTDLQKLRGTYYYQWFLDSELGAFLTNATQWLGLGTDPTKVPDGLIPATLDYAAQKCYDKLSLWFSTKASVAFLLEDAPDASNAGVIDSYDKMAAKFGTAATNQRNEFYSNRQGQALAPRFSSISGRVREIVPRR